MGKGLDPRPGQKAEAHKGLRHGWPALWVLNLEALGFSALCAPQAFVCSSSPAVPFSSPLDNPPFFHGGLEAPIKASRQRPAQHVPRLTGPSQDLAPPVLGNKKRGGSGPTGSSQP